MATEWTVEQREPGWLGRLIAPGGGRPTTSAFLLGVLAAGCFVASLVLDWQSATFSPQDFYGDSIDQTIRSGIASHETLGLVYTLGVVGLLGIVGATLTRPELALNMRMATAGVTMGLVGVLVAVTVRMSDAARTIGIFGPAVDPIPSSYEAGVFFGYGAVLVGAAAVFVAGRPAARALAAATADREASADGGGGQPDARSGAPAGRAGYGGGKDLAVSSGPLDLTVLPGDGSVRR